MKASTDAGPAAGTAPPTRGRLGLLVPSSNTTVEPEFYRALPAGVSLHCARLYLTRIDPASIQRTQDDLEQQSRALASADVDLILLGATAPSFLQGMGYDREVAARIASATGKPATTTSTAVLAALEALGVRRIALGKPVVTTTQASLWLALRLLGHAGGLPGYGSLFAHPAPASAAPAQPTT